LDDHIADLLLDASAMGVNVIEREGISLYHPSKFILVGTMSPEEGELRLQLLDRFGLSVKVEMIDDIERRMEVVKLREKFDKNPFLPKKNLKKVRKLCAKK
jgi:magnesium chelatase subunit D